MTIFTFLEDDPGGLWKKGDTAEDLGWESTKEVGQVLMRLRKTGEVISLQQPIQRGLVIYSIQD